MQLIGIYQFEQQNIELAKLDLKQLQLANTTLTNQKMIAQIQKKLTNAIVVNNTEDSHLILRLKS